MTVYNGASCSPCETSLPQKSFHTISPAGPICKNEFLSGGLIEGGLIPSLAFSSKAEKNEIIYLINLRKKLRKGHYGNDISSQSRVHST